MGHYFILFFPQFSSNSKKSINYKCNWFGIKSKICPWILHCHVVPISSSVVPNTGCPKPRGIFKRCVPWWWGLQSGFHTESVSLNVSSEGGSSLFTSGLAMWSASANGSCARLPRATDSKCLKALASLERLPSLFSMDQQWPRGSCPFSLDPRVKSMLRRAPSSYHGKQTRNNTALGKPLRFCYSASEPSLPDALPAQKGILCVKGILKMLHMLSHSK